MHYGEIKKRDIPFSIKNVNDTIGEIFGIPIAYNDRLQFGEVDIV